MEKVLEFGTLRTKKWIPYFPSYAEKSVGFDEWRDFKTVFTRNINLIGSYPFHCLFVSWLPNQTCLQNHMSFIWPQQLTTAISIIWRNVEFWRENAIMIDTTNEQNESKNESIL